MNKLEKIYEDLKANGQSIPEDLEAVIHVQRRNTRLSKRKDKEFVKSISEKIVGKPSRKQIGYLTRDMQILPLLAKGLTIKQIGKEIYLSHRSVDTYVSKMIFRYDCKNRTHLIAKTLAMGLFENPLAPMKPLVRAQF